MQIPRRTRGKDLRRTFWPETVLVFCFCSLLNFESHGNGLPATVNNRPDESNS